VRECIDLREWRSLVEDWRVGSFDVRCVLARCDLRASVASLEWRAVDGLGRSGEDRALALPLASVRMGELR
jgi:hypothetical protein